MTKLDYEPKTRQRKNDGPVWLRVTAMAFALLALLAISYLLLCVAFLIIYGVDGW